MGLYNNSGYNTNNAGWWCTYPFEKYNFVSWDIRKIKIHVPSHKSVYWFMLYWWWQIGWKNRFTFVFRVSISRYSLRYLDSKSHNCGAHHRMYIALGNGIMIYHDLSITGNWMQLAWSNLQLDCKPVLVASWCQNHKLWLLHVVGLLSM